MATTTAWTWSDADLLRPSRKSYSRLGQPVTPLSGTRKVSGKRKRSSTHAVEDHPLKSSPAPVYRKLQIPRIVTPSSEAASPAPLVNESYKVAPGFDTPGMSTAVGNMNIRDTPELNDYRSTWETSSIGETVQGREAIAREENARTRTFCDKSAQQAGWTTSAFGIFGGVAGKLLSMCYSIIPTFNTTAAVSEQDFDLWHRSATPLPGMFPEDALAEVDDTPIRPAKRLHLSPANDWVMVEDTTSDPTTQHPSLTPHRPASRASTRRSLAPRSRKPSSISHPSPSLSTPPLPHHSHTRRASLASPRCSSPRTLRPRTSHLAPRRSFQDFRSTTPQRDSLSPEAHALLHRREKKERDADKSMRKMSRQVQELIRQGQRALGEGWKMEFDEEGGEGYGKGEGEWDEGVGMEME
ncbi:hypothetical protein KVT40_002170 [Elsinoe batatas]|uniref:Uncharacterized protein n=1 Tax=Elsinoe batatas TaxID=2601811 RepID=A0A8K0L5Z5_9PEZI|nr:hypothetical protein KVT40_002170 [Elsinoe batatas]